MSKRNNWIAYCALTVLIIVLFPIFIKLSDYLLMTGQRRYQVTPYIITTLIGFPVLWGLLLSVRSRCYRKVIGRAADLIPEILLILPGLATAVGIAFPGMLFMPPQRLIQQFMAIFPAMFAGIALTDIAAGIGQIRKKETEPVIQEENE